MELYKNLLSPRDFSATSEHALALAIDLARKTGASLHVMHAEVLHSDPVAEREAAERATSSQAIEERLRQRPDGSEVDLEGNLRFAAVREIAAAPAILRYAQEHDIDLIVMGTHGRRGVRRLFLGSVMEEVVRAASCDVLVVRSGGTGFERHPIVVAVDFSVSSQRALLRGRQMAARFASPLHVVHAAYITPYPALYGLDVASRDLPAHFVSETTSAVHSFIKQTGGPEVADLHVEVLLGQPFQRITEYAASVHAGLIVVGTRGLAGIQHVLLGSTAERTIRTASTPVLVTKLPPDSPAGPASSFPTA